MGYLISNKIRKFIQNNRCTLLGAGPMSRNCIDASINLSNKFEVPLMLIASRRQIDSKEFGGGYVNNWDTKEYSEYIINKDKKGKIILCRDHGGPWQNPKEVKENMSLKAAMESAKTSYKNDIDSGFELIHIDPSIDIHAKPSKEEILERVFELYEFCWSYALKQNREITFEIGTEEQSISTNTQEELEDTLSKMKSFCKKNHLPDPTFVVVQTGTKVIETENIGSFDTPVRQPNEIPVEIQVPKVIEICKKNNILLKEHNCDYLSDESLKWHPRFGIHASNVAPEFGVHESRALINLMEKEGLNKLRDKFLNIAFDSQKWKKWLKTNSTSNDYEKSIMAMHYVFSNKEFIELKEIGKNKLNEKNIDLDLYLTSAVEKSILRYLLLFKVVK
tara:strand:+ start:1333 stop:2505 length:1173 start_codon:yes stop_codon:yes gene_type:complete